MDDEYDAPPGAVWVCQACGKKSSHRVKGWDSSCFTWAVLCDADSVVTDSITGRVVSAIARGVIPNMTISAKVGA